MPPLASDATADFYTRLNDPTKWIVKTGVPVFKAHQRTDPATGKLIQVDEAKLYRIAANMQTMERQGGVPIRMTLGHTEPGKAETEQPPIGGYYRNARVQPFGPKGEPAVVVDEWLDPQYKNVRKNFPYRSAEYYDDAEQITGVALLTRDPFLDLGVVAYDAGRTAPVHGPTMYHMAPGQTCLPYRFILGDATMYPPNPGAPAPYPAPGVPGAPQFTAVPPGYAPTPPAATPYPTPYATAPQPPAGYVPPPAPPSYVPTMPAPTPYAAPPAPYSHPWPGPAYQRPTMHRNHPSGGAVYSQQPRRRYPAAAYATEPPPEMGGGEMPPGGDGGGGGVLEALYEHLSAAVQILAEAIGGGGGAPGGGGGMPPGQAPQAPMPQMMSRRTGPGRPAPRGGYGRYAGTGTPTNYDNPAVPRTISGQPVGYQMKVDQLQYQLAAQNKAMQVLLYERDQADTESCVAEIRRLATMGYPVGEYEVSELKSKPKGQREAYLDHIVTHYQKVPTDQLPPLLGDPTPGQDINQNRPLTREEMEAALSIDREDHTPQGWNRALQYMRQGGQPPAAFPNPYPEPGMNGHAG